MTENEYIYRLNCWARTKYTFDMSGEGNGRNHHAADRITIQYPSHDKDTGKSIIMGYVQIKRVPSHFNARTRKALGKSYRMMDCAFDADDMLQVIHDMQLDTDDMQEAVMGKQLKRSDLYYIEELFVETKFREKGLAMHMLRSLPEQLRLHLHERKPVIAVIPYPLECKPEDPDIDAAYNRLVALYKRQGYSFPEGSTNTMIFNLE